MNEIFDELLDRFKSMGVVKKEDMKSFEIIMPAVVQDSSEWKNYARTQADPKNIKIFGQRVTWSKLSSKILIRKDFVGHGILPKPSTTSFLTKQKQIPEKKA
jgi:hypothetical protein